MLIKRIFLFCVVMIALLFNAGCNKPMQSTQPKAENGIIDLTQFNFEDDSIELAGKWEFYWQQRLLPEQVQYGDLTGYINVPSSWNKFVSDDKSITGNGYATYRLTFISDNNRHLALKVPRLHTAYMLWINGEEKASAGIVGEDMHSMVPQYLPQVIFFDALQGENEIIIHISNFYQRSGGMLEGIVMGSEQIILDQRYKKIVVEQYLLGILMFVGIYHVILYLFRKKYTPPLYFGIFCILLSIRTMMVGENLFIYMLPDFNWELAHKIQTLTYYLGVPVIACFFTSVVPELINKKVLAASKIFGYAFVLLVLITPVRIFSIFNPVYQVWTCVLSAYILYKLCKPSVIKQKRYILISIGTVVLLFTGLNDIIFHSILRNDYGPSIFKNIFVSGNLSSLGQMIFAFINSVLLAKRFSNSLAQEEIMIHELTEINIHLDELVYSRTLALTESNKKIEQQKAALEKANSELLETSLKDPLTQLWNRRKYDEMINIEWYRCLRHKRPIALLMLDIDNFKEYNDAYGHIAGDDCLVKLGTTITNALSRATDMVARYGGEEFIVLLPETDKNEAIYIANMLWGKVKALQLPHKKSLADDCVSLSIGVASMVPEKGDSHKSLLAAADNALYKAKAQGKNKVVYYEE